MKFLDEAKGAAAIRALAEQKGVAAEEIEAEICRIIDEVWRGGDPTCRSIFRGRKPSPALFVGRLAAMVK